MVIITLKDLKIGDKFYPKSKVGKSTPIFEVIGPSIFNIRHGRPTRMCRDLSKNIEVSKSSALEVITIK